MGRSAGVQGREMPCATVKIAGGSATCTPGRGDFVRISRAWGVLLTACESVYYEIPRRPQTGPQGPFAGAVGRLRNNWQATKRQWNMIKVKSRGNETVDQMLRRFKKLCEKEGLIKDMKRVSYYEKPSEKRRRRMRKSQKRDLKAEIG